MGEYKSSSSQEPRTKYWRQVHLYRSMPLGGIFAGRTSLYLVRNAIYISNKAYLIVGITFIRVLQCPSVVDPSRLVYVGVPCVCFIILHGKGCTGILSEVPVTRGIYGTRNSVLKTYFRERKTNVRADPTRELLL